MTTDPTEAMIEAGALAIAERRHAKQGKVQTQERWLTDDLEISRAVLQAALRQPSASSPDDAYILWFEDRDRELESFSGTGAREAAHRRYEEMRCAWSCHLYRRVADGTFVPLEPVAPQGDISALTIAEIRKSLETINRLRAEVIRYALAERRSGLGSHEQIVAHREFRKAVANLEAAERGIGSNKEGNAE